MLKNMLLLEFSSLGHPFLRVTAPVGKEQLSFVIELTEQQLTNGCITDIEPIAARIERECPQKLPICLSLSCEGIFRNRFTLPKMSATRAKMLYRRERGTDKYTTDYYIWEESFPYSGGHVFDRYYLPRSIVTPFLELATRLGVNLAAVEPAGVDVMRNLDFGGYFAYFYIRRNVCTLLLCDNGHLITTYDFAFESVEDIRRTFLLVAAKYELELDRKPIMQYGATSDIPFLLDMDLLRFNENGEAIPEQHTFNNDLLDLDFESVFEDIVNSRLWANADEKE